MPNSIDLNWIAIAVSTIVSGGLGAAWYSPALFGNAWQSALGKTQDQLGSPGPAIAGSIFSCFIASLSMAILLSWLAVDSLVTGAGVGALVGFGVVAMTMLSDSLFSGWGWKLYAIQMSYRALYLILIGGIYAGWPA